SPGHHRAIDGDRWRVYDSIIIFDHSFAWRRYIAYLWIPVAGKAIILLFKSWVYEKFIFNGRAFDRCFCDGSMWSTPNQRLYDYTHRLFQVKTRKGFRRGTNVYQKSA